MATGKVEAVKAGEIITVVYPNRKETPQQETVANPCDNKEAGQWYCSTHKHFFGNNIDKDTHIRTGNHRLVWYCHIHGMEQP